MARIAAANVTTNKRTGRKTVKPIDTAPRHARIARDNKAARAEARWLAVTETPEYVIGSKSHGLGWAITDCPYDGRTKKAREWVKGFEAAAKVARTAARKRA